ncbi:DinB family protein [Sutcliffiella rhizosphaerae]|uniref:Damage-inducible protein DinB n=1 Tax=Sutcliffiella rhizosphaerae TaxID=2880967 RepID=A0ABM8YKK6_9BACI|nr:DinB family protein [Sutcliffiella rhizosphaerae]CAG9620394.1 hypothetical protein BACCIP111883_01162 [Sutcliffiella rhizosphaerae]
MEFFANQHEWIKRTRETLFDYCEGMEQSDYLKELESFGGDSIRNLHVHVAGCYQFWLGKHGLGKTIPKVEPETVKNVHEMKVLFQKIDDLVEEFLQNYKDNWGEAIPVTFRTGDSALFSTLWLFTHTTTHEFHHKGQIVKIGRQLGYIPPDTDLIDPRLAEGLFP